MKPSPPVTRHRRPATASTGMGSRARPVYGDPVSQSAAPGPGTVTVAETRTSPSTDEPHRELGAVVRRGARR